MAVSADGKVLIEWHSKFRTTIQFDLYNMKFQQTAVLFCWVETLWTDNYITVDSIWLYDNVKLHSLPKSITISINIHYFTYYNQHWFPPKRKVLMKNSCIRKELVRDRAAQRRQTLLFVFEKISVKMCCSEIWSYDSEWNKVLRRKIVKLLRKKAKNRRGVYTISWCDQCSTGGVNKNMQIRCEGSCLRLGVHWWLICKTRMGVAVCKSCVWFSSGS